MALPDPDSGAPRHRRRRRTTAELRNELLTAAVTIFARRGYGGASIKEIADFAHTPQASIYRHYGSKAELFVAAVADPFIELIDDYTATVTEQLRTGTSPEQVVEAHIASLYDHLYAKRVAVLALISASGDPDAEQPVRNIVDSLNVMFETFHRFSVELWERDASYQIEHARLWLRLVAGMVVSATALEPLFLPDGWYKPARSELINVMSRMVSHGILDNPDKGSGKR